MTVLDPTGQDRVGVVLAHALRKINAARERGLISGGPDINPERCEWLIALGRERDVEPTEREITHCVFRYIIENGLAEPEDGMHVLGLVMGW